MNRESATYDESDRVEKMMQDADAFAQIRNTVLLNNLNNFFAFCFEELRDLSVEGFDNLYVAVNKYFDCLEKTAVLVRDKRPAFRREFADIVCEQIDILYRGTCNTGCDHIFLKRLGIKGDFYSDETIREEVERLIGHGTNDDIFSLFEEDTATDRFFYPGLVELEKRRVQDENGDYIFDEELVDEAEMASMMPSSVDMEADRSDKNVRGIFMNTRFRLALATGAIMCAGAGIIMVQHYSNSDNAIASAADLKPGHDDKREKVFVSAVSSNDMSENEANNNKKKVEISCKIDRNSEAFGKYLARLKEASPRVFISNFQEASQSAHTNTSTSDVESVKRDLFLAFLREMGKRGDDKLTSDFVEIHTRNFKSFKGGDWKDGTKQTALIYNAIEPDCE